MAHKAMIDGTAYEVGGGKAMAGGTVYDIANGKTLVDGTIRELAFSNAGPVTLNITAGAGSGNIIGGMDTYGRGFSYVEAAGSKHTKTGSHEVEGPVEIKVHVGQVQYDEADYICKITHNGVEVARGGPPNYYADYTFTVNVGTVTIEFTNLGFLSFFANIITDE